MEYKDIWQRIDEADIKPQTKALLAVAYDTGARVGELQELQLGDLQLHGPTWTLRLRNPGGERTVVLTRSVPYLMKWFYHRVRKDCPDSRLWTYEGFSKTFQHTCRRVLGLPHPALRQLRATELASSIGRERTCEQMGWHSLPKRIEVNEEVLDAVVRTATDPQVLAKIVIDIVEKISYGPGPR